MGLLTVRQYKLDKSLEYGVMTAGFQLAPADEAAHLTGQNVCPLAGHCKEFCLRKTGQNVTAGAATARVRRTVQYFRDPAGTVAEILREGDLLAAKAAREGLEFAIRPNTLSDLPKLGLAIAKARPEWKVYDYTKLPRPWLRARENYHLTFSYSERATRADVQGCERNGTNIAVVLPVLRGGTLPKRLTIHGVTRRVIDGDVSDLRYRDPERVFVGLRWKGSAAKMTEAQRLGFVYGGA